MKSREKILLALFVSAIVLWRGLPMLRSMVLGRLDDDTRRLAALKSAKTSIDDKEFQLQMAQHKLAEWVDRSLPPEPVEAQRLYQEWLTDLAEGAGMTNIRVTPDPLQVTPDKSFRPVRVSVKAEATFEQLTYFLHQFYRIDLLQRIQALKVEGPPTPGGPLKITITAEGLCLHDAHDRNHLFPRTELAKSLPRSFDTVTVASAEEFPKEPGFVVRIDNGEERGSDQHGGEYAVVTKIDGDKWTVTRAAEGTTKAYHPAKSEIELFPVRFDQKDLTLEKRRKTLAKHPFVQPIPPAPVVVDTNDPARQTKLIGTTLTEKEQSAWLFNEFTRINTVVKKGSSISIGDVEGTVEAIEENSIRVKRGDQLWKLSMGKDLRSMTRGEAGSEDSVFSGFSDEGPDGRGGGDPGSRRGRSRRSRRSDRSEMNFDPRQ
jgi:hypothetical protein